METFPFSSNSSCAVPTPNSPSISIRSLYRSIIDTNHAATNDFERLSLARMILFLVFAIWVLKYSRRVFNQLTTSRRLRKFASLHGCASPKSLPRRMLGTTLHKFQLLTYTGDDLLDGLFAEKYKTYGTTHVLCDRFGTPKVVHTVDPANLNAILRTSWKDWRPSQSRTNTAKPLSQRGLLLTEGEEWNRNHRLAQHSMSSWSQKEVLRDEQHIQMVFDVIGESVDSGWSRVVDVLDIFHRMALDMSTAYIFGENAGALAELLTGSSNEWSYQKASETVRKHFALRARLGSLYWIADSPSYRQACSEVVSFTDSLIAKAIQKRKTGATGENENEGAVDRLLQEADDVETAKHIILDLIIAGQNMTGTMAAFVFAHIEQHKDIFERMRFEVLDVFGTEEEPKAVVSWDKMRSCTTIQHVILETLRLYPLLTNIGRNAKRDTVLPHGGGEDGLQPIAIPKGASIITNLYLMHRQEEFWGSDAWEFNPDRWIGRKFGPEYAPFGGGARVCIGQQLTMTNLSFLLTRMLQRYSDISAPDGRMNLEKGYKVTIAPKHGVNLCFQRYQRESSLPR